MKTDYFVECTASALVGGVLLCAWMLYALSGCGAPTPRDMARDAQPAPDLAPVTSCAQPCAWPTKPEDWAAVCGGHASRCYVPSGQQIGCCQ